MRAALPGIAAVGLVLWGLTQLRLEADVFGLLPTELPVIAALATHADAFGAADEALLSLRADDAGSAEQAAGALATAIEDADLSAGVVWQNPLREDEAARAELIAYLWYNAEPAELEALHGRLAGEREAHLQRVMGRIATSMQPQQIGRLMRDPYGFLEIATGRGELQEAGQDLFSTDERRFRLLFVAPPPGLASGLSAREAWLEDLRGIVAEIAADGVTVRVTGRPALDTELGRGMIRDMQLAAGTTLALVAALFWLVYRRFRPLLWLSALLVYVVAATVALGGALFGVLNAISLGFAAILLGLSAGYGLLLYQEFLAAPGQRLRAYQRAIGPSILWASATTAGAFLMVGRSSLPGMVQLGVLVALGIVIAALVMVAAYLWPLLGQPPAARAAHAIPGPGRRGGLLASVALLLAAVAVILLRPPGVDASTDSLGPRDGRAKAAMAEIDRAFARDDRSLWLLLRGADRPQVAERMQRARERLDAAVAAGDVTGFDLPSALWPRPGNQRENRPRLVQMIAVWPQAAADTRAAGFEAPAAVLGEAVIGHWQRYLDGGDAQPETPALRWLFERFMTRHDGGWLALGRLDIAQLDDGALGAIAAMEELDGVTVAGWRLASRALLATMAEDVGKVLLPMLAALLVLLLAAYRRIREVLLSLATLAFSCVLLAAVMSLAGWRWNLMNVMALPLLLGVAVDYSIHVQLALQRHRGSVVEMRRRVGQAILLAGTTTVIGFASLGLASNAGLASLGKVCASGVAIACLASVFLLPLWWQMLNGGGRESHNEEH